MTVMKLREIKCSVCAKPSEQFVVLSYTIFGSSGLDGYRPLPFLPQLCPHCGYVADSLDMPLPIDKSFLDTRKYLYFGKTPLCKDLQRLLKIARIKEQAKQYRDAVDRYIHAAGWAHEEGNVYWSRKAGKLAVKNIDILLADENADNKVTLNLQRADWLRRTGDFETVIRDYENAEYPPDENGSLMSDIMRFQVQIARAKDNSCYTIDSVTVSRPVPMA